MDKNSGQNGEEEKEAKIPLLDFTLQVITVSLERDDGKKRSFSSPAALPLSLLKSSIRASVAMAVTWYRHLCHSKRMILASSCNDFLRDGR